MKPVRGLIVKKQCLCRFKCLFSAPFIVSESIAAGSADGAGVTRAGMGGRRVWGTRAAPERQRRWNCQVCSGA